MSLSQWISAALILGGMFFFVGFISRIISQSLQAFLVMEVFDDIFVQKTQQFF